MPQDPELLSLVVAPELLALPAAERVERVLREQVVDGLLTPGVRLTEEVVAARLAVSRNTVREAFAVLIAERLCERKTNRGVFVVVPTVDMVRDVYAYRMLNESAAILWGSGHTPDAVAAIRAAVADARLAVTAGDWVEVASANQRFHRGIAALSGSDAFARYFSIALAEMRLAFASAGHPRWQEPYVERNSEVLALLEAGRPDDAAAALRRYLADARDDVLARLSTSSGRPARRPRP